MSRATCTRAFLWLSVVVGGVGLGAKLFDLLVVARAWGASPPSSLLYYPYGKHWPMNPGDFFQPLSVVWLIAVLGALISGWKTAPAYRVWIWIPVAAFVVIWVATPAPFWPIILELYRAANGKIVRSDAELAVLVRHWFIYDWLRIAVIAISFFSSIRAISIPYQARVDSNPSDRQL